MSEKTKCLLGDLLFLAVGIGMYIYADAANYPVRIQGDVGSAFVPKLICASMIVLSLAKIVMILLGKRISSKKETDDNTDNSKGILVILVLAVYCIGFRRIGFVLMTPIMLFLEMELLLPKEKRNAKQFVLIALISVVTTVLIFVVFFYGLKLMLPVGVLKYIF